MKLFQGDYNNYECGLTVAAATAEDDGEWECDFESYVKVGKFAIFREEILTQIFYFFSLLGCIY